MAQSAFPVKKALVILAAVAVVAILAAVLTAEHIGPVTLLIIAGIAGLGGLFLYAWASNETKKARQQQPPDEQ